jgi:hypothetical protein
VGERQVVERESEREKKREWRCLVDGYDLYTCSRWGDDTRGKVLIVLPDFFYPTSSGNYKKRKKNKRSRASKRQCEQR